MTSSPSSPRTVVAVVILSGVLAAAHVGKLSPAMPDLRDDLGIGMVMGGWVASTLSLMGVCFSIVAGLLGDRFGAARMLALGLILCAVGGLGGALAGGPVTILLSRMVEGVGFVLVVVPAAGVIVAAVTGPDRRMAFGFWGAYMPLGTTLTIIFAPTAIDSLGWRGLWSAIALGCLACLWFVRRYLDLKPPTPTADGARPPLSLRRRYGAGFRHRGVVLASLIFSTYTLQWLSLMIWLPTMLMEVRNLPMAQAAWMTGSVIAINIPANLLGGWLLRRGTRHWQLIVAAASIMGVCGTLIFVLPTSLSGLMALCLAFSAGAGMLPPTVMACAPLFVSDPGEMGAANGLIVQGSHLGQVMGPPALAALVAHGGGWHGAVWLMAFGAGSAIILALLLARYERNITAA